MTDEKVIMLIEAKIQPQRRAELIEALANTFRWFGRSPEWKPFTSPRARTIQMRLFFTRFTSSKAAQDFHLQQGFTRKFLVTLKILTGSTPCLRAHLVQLPLRSVRSVLFTELPSRLCDGDRVERSY